MTHQLTAIVTGAAGGISLVYTKRLLEPGYRVVLAGLDWARGKSLQEGLGFNMLFVQCDVADWSSQAALFKAAHEWPGEIDVFIANAGKEEDEPFYDLPDNAGEPVKPSRKVIDVDPHSVVMAGLYEFSVAPVHSAAKHGVIPVNAAISDALKEVVPTEHFTTISVILGLT
ncbi:hypothetical protein QQZ08_003765 [Neonectria magnoliae]|uniref:Uncharacterized protein n=1 Tax=Neonectria magnoliae TaxID=2732573 RepID=A0ABR1I9N8_9HYPO